MFFSHSYFVIAIIVVSLVDKRAGFSNPEVVGSNPGSFIFFIFFYFFFFFLITKNIVNVDAENVSILFSCACIMF